MRELDMFDVRILRAVQAHGNLTQIELAERVHLSPSQCARRMSRLRDDGYIMRYAAILDHKKLGLAIVSHTLVSLRSHEDSANAAFRSFIQASPEVAECYSQTGDADYTIKIYCRDLDQLSEFLDRLIKSTGGLAALKSSIVLKEIKSNIDLPL